MSPEREIQQLMARYVRAVDFRDGPALASLFAPNGKIEIYYNANGTFELIGERVGLDAITAGVGRTIRPYPERAWGHHTTLDPIIEIDGNDATLDAQFVVYKVLGDIEPAEGWPSGAVGAQGRVMPIETGYYRPSFVRIDGSWRFSVHRVVLDLPMVFPKPSNPSD